MKLINAFPVVIFDLFHTLTSLEAVQAPGSHTSAVLGVSRNEWLKQLFEHSHERLTGKITDPFLVIERLAHAIDPDITDTTIQKAVENRISRFRYALLHPDSDTIKTLQTLKNQGRRLGLISNADVMEKQGWEDSPLAQFFDDTFFSCDTGYMKPDAAIYELCMRTMGVSPGECMYAGDGSHNELKTAHELGMTTILVTHVIKTMWPERIPPAQPFADYEIERLSLILTLTSDHDLLT